jgi:hypothetical protein
MVSPSLITPFALAFIFSLISAFNFDVEVCSNIDITSVEANARNSDKNSFWLKLREASSFAQKQTPLTPYELKDFVIRNAEEYLHTYANRRAHIVAHNKAYGHIEAVRGKQVWDIVFIDELRKFFSPLP